ncbi:hypothetical protein [Geoalkalibacter subterraneus]|uniref:hypothetical protein n=1 Tax=Geoalkalibacter subterraneus TaxID=483547 RepID=UPI000694B1F6|nr:hypothetical protein [Geoalkalibacter subterraneus]
MTSFARAASALSAIVIGLVLFLPAGASGEDRITTLWPLFDDRRSDAVDYRCIHILGPLIKYERKGPETEFSIRPFYFGARDHEDEVSLSEYLFPLARRQKDPGKNRFHFFHLLELDFGEREQGSNDEFMLFPFLFYGELPDDDSYFAFFPFGGRIVGRFWRDEIRFALFPLYGQTIKDDTQITNILWPIYARIEGENERGFKLWPFYGQSEKEGHYRKRFAIWPIYFNEHLRQDSDNPLHRKAYFPFYIREDSPLLTRRTWLWPFFSHVVDRDKGFEEWNMPWPLIRVANGPYKESRKFLPFYSYERTGAMERTWHLWPFFLETRLTTDDLVVEKNRILFFLYAHDEERLIAEETEYTRKERVALWPLFTFENRNGVRSFSTLSLLRPFFPRSEAIERNWTPLWTLYAAKWDSQGNSASTLLWNLFWREQRGDDVAMEVFPLFRYERQDGEIRDFRLLKGLIRYTRDAGEKKLSFLYTPWGWSWEGATEEP